jgi:phage shock protein C
MSDLNQTQQVPMEQGVRRLLRSRSDRVLGGVCGGLGRYLNVDPVLLRIAAVALALSGGAGVIAYIVAWIVIPEDTGEEPPGPPAPAHRHGIAVAVGAGLIALGALLVLRDVLPWFGWVFWPVVVVGVGVLVLISARR